MSVRTKIYFICNGCGIDHPEDNLPVNSEFIPEGAKYTTRDKNGEKIIFDHSGFYCSPDCKNKYLKDKAI